MTPLIAAAVVGNPALAQLKDIHLPEPITSWPTAPGYYLLLLLVILVTIGSIWLYKSRQSKLAASRQALSLLDKLDMTATSYATDVNTLLKRTALSYQSRHLVASLDGKAWISLLGKELSTQEQTQLSQLLALRFSPKPLQANQASELKQLAAKIINSLAHSARLTKAGGSDAQS